ncbi:conserved hypothetical protein [Gloeothece citriformis PCC 7424]|uniref:ATP-binding protein n=1 Tax=Gloeothece citriformis (strain PCC 7424) TaxID=65393 RepID=B7K9J2_GLOC7|nr:hypothetical protein [Gloeothece citriformis]ACK69960.1 conserved hypothetical protein [Gloeothece citriformis PCC 7424]
MSQIFGDFRQDLPESEQCLMISFSPCSVPLQQRWCNNGLSADFVANYLATFFPCNKDDPNSLKRQAHLKSTVSYIANELLENATKFHDENTTASIQLGTYLIQNLVILLATNCSSIRVANQLELVIEKLINSEPEELYIQHLEMLAEDENYLGSGLGFLTIIHDYFAKIGWKIEPLPSEVNLVRVTTMVQVRV